MIQTINILIKKLYLRIPKPILELAFEPRKTMRSLDNLIHEEIIQSIVLVDCNLYAGKMKKISLRKNWLKQMDTVSSDHAMLGGHYTVYEVPLTATEGRPISHVIDVAYPSILSFNGAYPMESHTQKSVSQGLDNLLGSYSGRDNYMTPTPILRGQNIVELVPTQIWSAHEWLLTCLISYDKDFSNISPNMVNPLFECVLYATQQYIYSKLSIMIDSASLSAGQELATIREIVSEYKDAGERYNEALLTWRGSATFDKDTMISIFSDMLS